MKTALWLTVGLLFLQEMKPGVGSKREKRSILDMISTLLCYRDRLRIPLLALNLYGCHCGTGGFGKPLDAVDRCCFLHDCCYCHTRLSLKCHNRVKWQRYEVLCKTSGTECRSKSTCGRAACECDKRLAECLTAAKPQRKHYFYKRELCQGSKGTCPIMHHNWTKNPALS